MLKALAKILSAVSIFMIVFLPSLSAFVGKKKISQPRASHVKIRQNTYDNFNHLSVDSSWHFIKNRQLVSPNAKLKVKPLSVISIPRDTYRIFHLFTLQKCRYSNDGNIFDHFSHNRIYIVFRRLLI